jgi:hypothetical protein
VDIEEALVTLLKADPAVTALIGVGNDARIYPESAPQNAGWPRLTYLVVDWPSDQTLSGPSGYCTPRIQFDCWASARSVTRAYATAKALVRAVRERLDGYSGQVNGLTIHWCKLIGREAIPEMPVSGDEAPVRRISLDFEVAHNEQ